MSKGILLSGGIDSIALAFWSKPTIAFTINYGQLPAEAEIRTSKRICQLLNIQHITIEVDCQKLGSGDLLLAPSIEISPSSEWWPFRNQLLITLACMKGVSLGVKELLVGSVLSDSFHKDGAEDFFMLINNLVNFQEGNLQISAPAIHISSFDLVLISGVTPDILYYAHSCHKGNYACGNCRGCYKYMDIMQKLKDVNW